MNRPEAEQIASAVSMIRPRWLQSSLVTILGKLPDHLKARPARDVHLALLWLAYDPQQDTPRLLREDGPWWNLAALTGPGTQQTVATVTPLTCEHGNRPSRCDQCSQRRGVPPSPEHKAAIRAALAEAQDRNTRKDHP